ncbi:sensor histidine kinase [Streptomyces sp. NPDC052236]|uniref:sensor histidine kinase n=1 Tax=Streptomyces sp. NPDC052236 TaxID=3365686 RepID=UPI0037D96DA6
MSPSSGVKGGTGPQPLTRLLHLATQRIRAFDRRHPLVWDLLLPVVAAMGGLADLINSNWRIVAPNPDVPAALVAVITAGFVLPLAWRRRRPHLAMTVVFVAVTLNGWTGAAAQISMTGLVVLFNVTLRASARGLAWMCVLLTAQTAVTATRWPDGDWGRAFVPPMMSLALVMLLAIAVRSRQEYTASLVQRAEQLEIERDQQARLAAAAERARIAREMHDIIGHNLAVITGLADGGSYAAASGKNPQRAGQALDAIGTTSRQALGELRRLLDVLREDPPTPDLTPQPSLADLEALVEGVREAGLPVRLTTSGAPRTTLSPGRQLTVYRVVQESLTNTLKHAGPQDVTAEVTLTYTPDALEAVTTDTGRGGVGESRSGTGGGRGIRGMRERTSLYGGTLKAGPVPSGWQVCLTLPLND